MTLSTPRHGIPLYMASGGQGLRKASNMAGTAPVEPLLCNPDLLVSFMGHGGHCLGAATTMADAIPR